MKWPDLTQRSNAIMLLFVLDIFFFCAMIGAYMMPHGSDALRAVCRDAFLGVSSPLLLALKMGGPDTPNPPNPTSGTAQTTTTVTTTAEPEAKP